MKLGSFNRAAKNKVRISFNPERHALGWSAIIRWHCGTCPTNLASRKPFLRHSAERSNGIELHRSNPRLLSRLDVALALEKEKRGASLRSHRVRLSTVRIETYRANGR